ncbi:hypothetical protein K505DRAFT_368670 [Melanomma pulvis-pyrius CBS 109.77]|uniref:MD-2-related lipid-recognition domain-containing protein n=1 Tax=Melanomma pulvis-pyrius CBS 109.77 TaxID=1314802 RepID=A0A6A6WPS7_9PLEO|nr:hypothetical protein K505DRAFT_368670 [Melanomma pulvis-pyrius CBS 109.77]
MKSGFVGLLIGAVGANVSPRNDEVYLQHSAGTATGTLPGGSPFAHCTGSSQPKDDVFQISKLEMHPLAPRAGDYLYFTITGKFSSSVSDASTILVEHTITGHKGRSSFPFCDKVSDVEQNGNGTCPPEEGEAVIELLGWTTWDIPGTNYTFSYTANFPDGTGIFCVNGTVWVDGLA